LHCLLPWVIFLAACGQLLLLLGSVSPLAREVLNDTHLQHLRVVKDLVVVASLADRKDPLGEIGAFV
jgi:hypothetical protein